MEFLFSLSINKYKILAIFWNLFLAGVPCLVVYYLGQAVGKKKWNQLKNNRWAFGLIFLFWLFMLPNAAYLFFIVRHLVDYCFYFDKFRVCREGNSWMVIFFFTYALMGVPAFYYALNKMSRIFRNLFSGRSAALLPLAVIPLVSIGVMFGLFERYNSWDLLTRIADVFRSVLTYFTDLNLFLNFLAFTLSFYLIYYGMDYFLWKMKK